MRLPISNWHPFSYRFGVIAAYCSKFGHLAFSSHSLGLRDLGVRARHACRTRCECLVFDYVFCRFPLDFCAQFLHVDVSECAACDCAFRFLSSVRIVLFLIAVLSSVLSSFVDMQNGL